MAIPRPRWKGAQFDDGAARQMSYLHSLQKKEQENSNFVFPVGNKLCIGMLHSLSSRGTGLLL